MLLLLYLQVELIVDVDLIFKEFNIVGKSPNGTIWRVLSCVLTQILFGRLKDVALLSLPEGVFMLLILSYLQGVVQSRQVPLAKGEVVRDAQKRHARRDLKHIEYLWSFLISEDHLLNALLSGVIVHVDKEQMLRY